MKNFLFYLYLKKIFFIIILFHYSNLYSQSGNCDINTPYYLVDLSSSIDSVWISPLVVRDGNCCGTTNPDRCIEFYITMNPGTIAIRFSINSGAIPPGSMFYQIGCGPQVPVGDAVCLQAPGPYTLTFCKPGNNENTYKIEAIPAPNTDFFYADVNGYCSIMLNVVGLDPATVHWTDISYGGLYDSYLSCTNCLTPIVNFLPDHPPYVDYKVCGEVLAPACYVSLEFCDTVRVYFYDQLNVSLSEDTTYICEGESHISLIPTVSGGLPPYQFYWYFDGSVLSNDSIFDASESGTYILEVRDSTYPSCLPFFDTILVNFAPLPTITASANPTEICLGESSDLMVSSDITGTTFNWSNGIGTNPNVTVSPTTTTTYSVTGTTNEGCTGTASVTVTVHPLPTITATANQSEICLGESSDLMVSSDITGTTFSWSNGLGTNPNVTVSPTTTTTYSVTGTTNEGCTGTASITVTVHPLPTINFLVNSAHCGHSDGSILLNINGAVPPYTFIWSNGYMDANLNNIVAGNYIVTVTDAIGCMSIANIYVEDLPGPTANFTFKPQMTTIENPIIYFQNYSTGATSYYWTFGDDNSSEEYAPNHVYMEPGSYHVVLYAIDDYNCIDTVGAQIIIKDISTFYIPNAIMPHRRNINSIFNIFGVNIDPDNFEMRIYNRWGNQIFYTTNPNIGWDGTYNGEYVQEGSYTYIFNFITETDGVKHTILGKVLVLY